MPVVHCSIRLLKTNPDFWISEKCNFSQKHSNRWWGSPWVNSISMTTPLYNFLFSIYLFYPKWYIHTKNNILHFHHINQTPLLSLTNIMKFAGDWHDLNHPLYHGGAPSVGDFNKHPAAHIGFIGIKYLYRIPASKQAFWIWPLGIGRFVFIDAGNIAAATANAKQFTFSIFQMNPSKM